MQIAMTTDAPDDALPSFVPSFLPFGDRWSTAREKERENCVAFGWNGRWSKVDRKGAKQCDRTLERRRISWEDAGLEDESAWWTRKSTTKNNEKKTRVRSHGVPSPKSQG